MNDTRALIHVDDLARSSIRQALRRYMEESRIGTPTLQERIIKADVPRHREIPLSTLQRFLRGSHQTSDDYVRLCHDFVKELPYYGEGKDIGIFGAAASMFFAQVRDAATHAGDIESSYEVIFSPRENLAEGNPLRLFEGKIAELSLVRDGDNPWLDVREDASPFNDENTRYRLEGIALYTAPYLHIFLRDLLTRLPRIYAVQKRTLTDDQGEHEIFEGQGHHGAPWQKIIPAGVVRFFDVKFLPMSKQGETP